MPDAELVPQNREIATREPEGITVLQIIRAAAENPQVDPAKLNALLDLQERLLKRNAEAEYTAAMAAMQPKLPRVRKNGTIDLGKGRPIPFARWEDIDAVIRPILTAYGFSLSFPTRIEAGQLYMACKVSHVGGHSERSEAAVMPDSGPGRNSSQAIGSGRKYTKRYLALDMLNIVTEDADDDGKASGFLTIEEAEKIHSLMDACEMNTPANKQSREAFLRFANAASVEQIQRFDLDRVMEALRAKERKMREGK